MKKISYLVLFAFLASCIFSPCYTYAQEKKQDTAALGPEGGFLVGGSSSSPYEDTAQNNDAEDASQGQVSGALQNAPASFTQQQSEKKAAQEPTDPKEKLKEIISVSFKDMDLKEALSLLADNYSLNILAGDEVKGNVTINFKDVPLEDVLNQILKTKNFAYRWEGNIIKIVSSKEEVETRAFFVNHISLDLASEIILDKLSKEGKSKINTSTNQLIITDTISNLDEIEKTIAEIDMPPAQVRIETKLIDISHTDLDNMGVKWETTDLGVKLPTQIFGENFLGSAGHGEKAKMTQSDYVNNTGSSTTLTGGQFVFNFAQAGGSVKVTLDALVRNNKAKVIANPSITTLNNVEARINIGEKYPIREQTQTSTGTLETTRFVDVGTTLKVTPKINKDNTIQLTVHPEVSSVSATLDAGPRITTREADTTVIVKDGETLIIAGLLQTQDDSNKSRVPFLGQIPIIGAIFSSRDKNKLQKELVIFMTPHILNRSDKDAYAQVKPVAEVDLVGDRLGALEMFNRAEDLEQGESLQAQVFPQEVRIAEAAKLYEQISLVFPTNYYADIGLARAASIYEYQVKDYDAAMACFMRIVENYPKSSYYTHAKRRISRLMERALGRKWPPKSKENKRETEEPSENNPVKTNIIPGRVAR